MIKLKPGYFIMVALLAGIILCSGCTSDNGVYKPTMNEKSPVSDVLPTPTTAPMVRTDNHEVPYVSPHVNFYELRNGKLIDAAGTETEAVLGVNGPAGLAGVIPRR